MKNDDSLVTLQEEMIEKWVVYTTNIYTYLHNKSINNPYLTPSNEEIEQQIKRLKNHKSLGKDYSRGNLKACR